MDMIRKFMKYYKPYKLIFFTDMACALTASGIDLMFPVLVRDILNRLQTQAAAASGTIIKIGILMFALYIIQYFCNYYITSWGHIMGARMEYDMRNKLFTHLQKLSFTYFDNNKTGQIMSRIVNDLLDIAELAHHGPEEIFISVTKILGAFIILLTINVKLTLITFAFLPVMTWFSFYYNDKMRAVFTRNKEKIADVNAQLEDSIAGVRVVQSFSNEGIEVEKFKKGNKLFLATKEDSYEYMGRFYSGVTLFEGLIYVSAAIIGALFIGSGSINAADLVAYLLFINTFLAPIRTILHFTEQFQRGMTGFLRYEEILAINPDIEDKEDAVDINDFNKDIVFEDVSFKYSSGDYVLRNISLTINKGETIALVGQSGGGKTTLCSLIPRFYDVTEGSIKIDGKDIRDIKLDSLRKKIGIVQQDVYLFAGSIMENIRYGKPDASDEEIIEASKNANAHEFIMAFENGYNTYVGERGVKLSGGQKQRISIARAFLKNPPVLILDEATSSLDNQSEKIVQQSLEKLSDSRTTLVIAHRLSTIKNADKILVLTDNGIEEEGSHDELLTKNGIYAALYNTQFAEISESVD
ncbi:putative multidrug export ATP-binding/permease protein [Oxobacter pfennigii]|uniref:Putative multidrug export ATP-binding/permease protein n=1 Tax=Oxobacter pfennigii TaxID=36849 RepID=A0A0P8WVU4_9CLOT|nr:ABC transporter ATP-binding protein [Oxobacter pfennigii]KPU42390.1 putative multidrug export ATP-binding/permease protein [Oxobacter pfennigii]